MLTLPRRSIGPQRPAFDGQDTLHLVAVTPLPESDDSVTDRAVLSPQ